MASPRPAVRRSRPQPPTTAPRPIAAAISWRAAAIVLAGMLAYANSLSAPFIFDDNATVVQNTHIRDWHPAVALLLFGLVQRTVSPPSRPGGTEVPRRDGGPREGRRSPGGTEVANVAFAVAFLWVLHPLNSEVVDYVTQRTESMMALFYLLTLYCAVRAAGQRRTDRWTIAAVACCAAGMACKESMVTAPIMVALYDRVFLYTSARQALRERWRLYAGLAATWIILAVLVSSGPRAYSAGFQAGVSSWTYLLNQSVMIARYLRLAVWPQSLVLSYGDPRPLSLADVLPSAILVVALLTATVVALVRRPRIGFLGAWFFITLAPTSSIVPIVTEVGAERRMYLPLIGLIALAVVAIAPRLRKAGAVTVLAVVSAALLSATVSRNREYRSALDIAETTFARWPTPFSETMV